MSPVNSLCNHSHIAVALGVIPSSGLLPPLPPLTVPAGGSPAVTVAPTLAAGDGITASGSAGPLASLLSLPDTTKQRKVWIGDGLPTIPKKLHDRMLQWEFIDLSELRPVGPLESIKQEQETQNYILGPGFKVAKAKNRQIEDISTWLQCFGVYVAVLAKRHPEIIGDMMAYMITIMRAQIEFEDPAWRTYDEAYRDKAATTGNRKWSEIDPHLYNKIFTGRAKKMAICSLCGNTGHSATGCKRKRFWDAPKSEEVKRRSLKPCWDYNSGGQCQYGDNCRFRHRCSECGDDHPVVQCQQKGGKSGKAGNPSFRNKIHMGPGGGASGPTPPQSSTQKKE